MAIIIEQQSNCPILSFNLNNISKWKELDRFLLVSEKFLTEKKWEGFNGFNKLEYLINKIKNK